MDAGTFMWAIVGIGLIVLGAIMGVGFFRWRSFRTDHSLEDERRHREGTRKVYREAEHARTDGSH